MFSSGRSKCLLLPQRESKQAATLTKRQRGDRIVMSKCLKLNWSGNKFAACLYRLVYLCALGAFRRWCEGQNDIIDLSDGNRLQVTVLMFCSDSWSEKTMMCCRGGRRETRRGSAVTRSPDQSLGQVGVKSNSRRVKWAFSQNVKTIHTTQAPIWPLDIKSISNSIKSDKGCG